jgi:hypothetical protein
VRGYRQQKIPHRPIFLAGSSVRLLAVLFCSSLMVCARDLSPAEMIEAHLARGKTLQTARQANLLSAICEAVKQNHSAAVAITSTAVARRAEYAGEIVETVLRCSGKVGCEYAGMVVAGAVAAAPQSASRIHDAAMIRAPGCAETIRSAAQAAVANPSANAIPGVGVPLGTTPRAPSEVQQDEGYDPLEPLRLVCDNETQRAIRESQVDDYLKTHPGAVLGSCPPTATAAPVNRGNPVNPVAPDAPPGSTHHP